MYLLHAVYVTRVTRTIDTGTCTYHPFAMVPVRYLAYGPYGGMTPFVVRGKSRGKVAGDPIKQLKTDGKTTSTT